MSGQEFEEQVSAYLAGELDEESRARLRASLLADRDQLRAYVRAVRFDQDLAAMVKARAERHQHGYPSERFTRHPPRRASRWLAAAAIAATVAVLAGGALLWNVGAGAGGREPGIVLAEASGGVQVARAAGPVAGAIAAGLVLLPGDRLIAEGGAHATARFADGTLASLRRGELALANTDGKRLVLARGLVEVRAAKQPPGHPLVVETARARAEVVGTAFALSDEAGLTTLAVSEGSVQFTDLRSGDRRAVPAGRRAIAGPELARRPAPAGARPADASLGIELQPTVGIGGAAAFLDLMRHAQAFEEMKQLDRTTTLMHLAENELPTGDGGWITGLKPGQTVTSFIPLDIGGEPGTWVCLYRGKGRLAFAGAKVLSSAPGRIELALHPNPREAMSISISELDQSDPLRDIHIVPAASEASFREHPFQAAFLARWRGCGVLRAEIWEDSGTQGHALSWSGRITDDAAPGRSSEAAEHLFQLAAELDADLWLTIPVEADDSYVAGLAELAHRRLGEGRRIYLEYGHAVWVRSDPNSGWVSKFGSARGYGPDTALERGYMERALEVFATWRRIFGDDPRLVRVLNFGPAERETLERMLAWHDAAAHADALAMDLTFGDHLDQAILREADPLSGMVSAMRAEVTTLLERAQRRREVARAHGLRLLGYGAGPSPIFAGTQATPLLPEGKDPTPIGAVLAELVHGWRERVGDLLCCDVAGRMLVQRGRTAERSDMGTHQALSAELPPPTP